MAPDEIVPVVSDHEPIAPEPVAECHDGRDNAEFIAHARTDVPALVAEVRRLRGLIGAWGRDVLEVEGVEVRPEYTTNTDRLLKEAIDIGLGL